MALKQEDIQPCAESAARIRRASRPERRRVASPETRIPFRHRLQTRMVASIVALLALLMLATTYVGIRRESRGILAQMQLDGVALARSFALSAENAILLHNAAGLGRVTGEASRTAGIKYLKIIDRRGVIIGHTDVAMIGGYGRDSLGRRALETPITAVEKGKRALTAIEKDKDGEDFFRVVIPLVILDTVQGALEIGLDMTGITEAVQQTNRQSLLIALGAFCFGGLFTWFFARSLMRPVRRLVEAAQSVAAGDLTHEIPVAGRDEIGHLAVVFNHMTREIKDYTDDLKRSNAQLEADAATIEKLRRYTANILASINPGVLAMDLEGRVTTVNRAAAALLGMAETSALGRPLEAFLPDGHGLRALAEKALRDGRSYQGQEIQLPGESGRETILLANAAALHDQDGATMGLALTFEDVTELRSLQKRITEAEKLAAMGELAVGIAHEVRNPLGAIKTGAQFLAARFTADDPRHKLAQLMIRESDRLNLMVERLMDFAKPAPGDLQYEDLNEVVERSLALAMLKADPEKIRVDRSYAQDLPRLFVDAKRLHQAFLNVLLNALDAMPDGGILSVATALEPDGQWLRLEFSDTGEGIPADKLGKIFSPFFTTRQKGTGLGLAIVHQVLAEHGGEVTARSSVGEGTTLTMRLPVPSRSEEG